MKAADRLLCPTEDPCVKARPGAARATQCAKDSIYSIAFNNIINAFTQDSTEHAIAFGLDPDGKIICSGITNGNVISGKIPTITRAFADIHIHPNDTPPDAGDCYGLIDINRNSNEYDTRFVITKSGTVYALLVTDHFAAAAFNINHPRQAPAFKGGPPGFSIAMVDEFREIKYNHNGTDEMAMAFILEKYDAGVSLLKQDRDGLFRKLFTSVSGAGSQLIFTVSHCQ